MIRLILLVSFFFCRLSGFSQTATASGTSPLRAAALQDYLQKQEKKNMSRAERRAAKRAERSERKVQKKEDRTRNRSSKKCPYKTTNCTYDWRDY